MLTRAHPQRQTVNTHLQGELAAWCFNMLPETLPGARTKALGVQETWGLGITGFQTRGAQMLLSDPLELAESLSHTTSLLISNNKQE